MDSDGDGDSDSDRSHIDDSDEDDVFDEEVYTEEVYIAYLQWVKNNDPNIEILHGNGEYDFINGITNEKWEEIGRDISNNTHLTTLNLVDGALNNEKISFLFRGLVRSNSVKQMWLINNELSIEGVRIMVPFLQNTNYLQVLNLNENNIQSEGFNILCRALRESPIETLWCANCGIESIEIDIDQFPRQLKKLCLSSNKINADGCREIAKLLQGGDSTLTWLSLTETKIGDEGVAILVDALRSNTSLTELFLRCNDDISKKGRMMLLKLMNDISSIKSALQSNHTLRRIDLIGVDIDDEGIQGHINTASTTINENHNGNPEVAGREKVIKTQLHSETRAELAELQGVNQSVYREIKPLHLPEVLSLTGHTCGLGELYLALKSSIAGVISTVNRRQCIVEKMAELQAERVEIDEKLGELGAELAAIDAIEGGLEGSGNKLQSNKRLRVV